MAVTVAVTVPEAVAEVVPMASTESHILHEEYNIGCALTHICTNLHEVITTRRQG